MTRRKNPSGCWLLIVALIASAGTAAEPDSGSIDPAATPSASGAVPDASTDTSDTLAPTPRPAKEIEEVIVREKKGDVQLNPVLIRRVRNDNGLGARLYRQRRYQEAFPYLLSAAQRGFKMAQARVSYIYQQGLGGIKRDPGAAVGWLGVAASPQTAPEIRDYYKRFRKHMPKEHLPLVDKIVARYTAQYGSEATGLHCDRERLAGTHISRLKCDFETEYDYRDVLDDEAIATGIVNSPGLPTEDP